MTTKLGLSSIHTKKKDNSNNNDEDNKDDNDDDDDDGDDDDDADIPGRLYALNNLGRLVLITVSTAYELTSSVRVGPPVDEP